MSFYLFLPFYAALVAIRRRAPQRQLGGELGGLAVLTAISYAFRWWALNIPLITFENGHFVAICAPHCGTEPWPASRRRGSRPTWICSRWECCWRWSVPGSRYIHSEPRWLSHRLMPWISWGCAAAAFWAVSHVVTDRSVLYFVTPLVNLERQALYGVFAFFLLLPAVFGPQDKSLVRRLLQSWPMASLGVISYGIYLWHLDLINQFMKWMDWHEFQVPYWLLAAVVLGMSVAFASASYFGLERPLLRMKNRIGWWNRPKSGAEGSGSDG